jgi:DNA-directed RNA polymerase specialized sigma24 family protein
MQLYSITEEDLFELLYSLPGWEGIIYYLHHSEGFDFQALSELSGMPELKVRILYHAALDHLGEMLTSPTMPPKA